MGKAAIVPAVMSAGILVALVAVAVATSAQGSTTADGIYKCRGTGSVPLYQQQPCPPGASLRDLVQDPANVSVIPFHGARPAPGPAAKVPRPGRSAPVASRAPSHRFDKRKAEAEHRTSDAAVVERRHLKDGMSDGEVLARLGTPDLQSGKGGRKMRWTYMPAPGDAQTVTQVHFVDGRVVSVDRTTLR